MELSRKSLQNKTDRGIDKTKILERISTQGKMYYNNKYYTIHTTATYYTIEDRKTVECIALKNNDNGIFLISKPTYFELTKITEKEYNNAIKEYKKNHRQSSKSYLRSSSLLGGRKTNRNKKYLKRRSIKLQR